MAGLTESSRNHYYVGKAEGSILKVVSTSRVSPPWLIRMIILNLRFSLLLPKPLMPTLRIFFGQVLQDSGWLQTLLPSDQRWVSFPSLP